MIDLEIITYLISSLILSWYFFKIINYEYFSIRGISLAFVVFFYPVVFSLIAIQAIFLDIKMQDLFYQGVGNIEISNTIKAYIVFISIFIIVELLTKRIKNVNNEGITNEFNGRIIFFIIFFVFALIIRIELDIYYHISINPDYNTEVNNLQSVVNRISWLGLLPLFLFQYKYFKTKKKIYMFISLMMIIVAILIYLPNGSRQMTFGFLPILLIYIITQIKSFKKKLFIGTIAFILISVGVVISGKLRVADQDFAQNSLNDDIRILVNRLSTTVITGQIMTLVPEKYSYRYFNNMEVLLYTPFPGFLRTALGVKSNFYDGVGYTQSIGISPTFSSIPVTLLGDFYSRFGWNGIIIFTTILAIILKFLDKIIYKKSNLFKFIFLVLYSEHLSIIYSLDLQVLFATITREFIIAFLLAYIITMFLRKKVV